MIAIGSDHAAIELKEAMIELLKARGLEYEDLGSQGECKVDYPEVAKAVAEGVSAGKYDKGILLCGTGIGMSMAANKVAGIRAAVCNDIYCARMTRAHNDANVLCVGQRVVGLGVALDILEAFLDTTFEGGRHLARIRRFDP